MPWLLALDSNLSSIRNRRHKPTFLSWPLRIRNSFALHRGQRKVIVLSAAPVSGVLGIRGIEVLGFREFRGYKEFGVFRGSRASWSTGSRKFYDSHVQHRLQLYFPNCGDLERYLELFITQCLSLCFVV